MAAGTLPAAVPFTRVPGDGAELDPKAHPRGDRLAPECLARLTQCRAALANTILVRRSAAPVNDGI